jgi:hypothetical protein
MVELALIEFSRGLWLLEAPPIRMATKDSLMESYQVLAIVGVFHQAI